MQRNNFDCFKAFSINDCQVSACKGAAVGIISGIEGKAGKGIAKLESPALELPRGKGFRLSKAKHC